VTCPGGATGGEGSVLKCPEHAPDAVRFVTFP